MIQMVLLDIENLIKAGEESESNKAMTDAFTESVQVYLEVLKFVTAVSSCTLASELKTDSPFHHHNVRELQNTILQKAEEGISSALVVCRTSDEVYDSYVQPSALLLMILWPLQKGKIKRQQSELHVLKQRLAGLSIEEQMRLLSTVVASDPRMDPHHTRGYLHRCPNGHFYIIGECGGAMQQSHCPECGATIGGSHHRLASGNTRVTAEEANRFGA